jgi:hypothetical protein
MNSKLQTISYKMYFLLDRKVFMEYVSNDLQGKISSVECIIL